MQLGAGTRSQGVVALLAAVLAGATAAGCGDAPPSESPDTPAPAGPVRLADATPRAQAGEPTDLATARRVLDRRGATIRDAYDGVVGYGIGAADPGGPPPRPKRDEFVIDVFLDGSSSPPTTPQSLAGVMLQFDVSGVVEAL